MSRSSSDEISPRNDGVQKYRGVRMREWRTFVTEIRLPRSRERIWLGSYNSAEKAARAFDAASYCLRGPRAKFNFPHDPPRFEIPPQMSRDQIVTAAKNYANAFTGGGRDTVQTEEDEMAAYWSTLQPLETNNNGWVGRNISPDFGFFDDAGDMNTPADFGFHDDDNGGSASSFP